MISDFWDLIINMRGGPRHAYVHHLHLHFTLSNYVGSRVNVEWSCGHKGYFELEWLASALVKPLKRSKIVAVSDTQTELWTRICTQN